MLSFKSLQKFGLATLVISILSACGGGDTGTDASGNKSEAVSDNIDPIITLIGSNTTQTIKGSNYIDAGATATDNHDGNITAKIVKAGDTVNTNSPAGTTFTITYNVSDTAGNLAIEVTRTVSILASTTQQIPILSEENKAIYLTLINNARAEARTCNDKNNVPTGDFPAVPPVTWSDKLYKSSYEHSQDLAKSNTFSHDGSGTVYDWSGYAQGKQSDMIDRVATYNYIWARISENISAGTKWDTPEEAIESWLKSPGHCHNMMSADVTEVGLALFIEQNSKYKHYWTQNFGKPQ